MKSHFEGIISPQKLADATGKQYTWIIRIIIPELITAGLAKRIGKPYICHESAIEYVNNRPETRGCKSK